jgi:peptidyl-tRNA hydrolase
MKGSFAKIVVGCNSEQELFDLQKQADEEGIVNALILDNGNTEFKQGCPECKGYGQLLSGFSHIQQIPCERCNETGKINKPTYTCLSIGPDLSDKIDKITGGLKLL